MVAGPKVVILAGGWGTRLGQVAERVPKPMVRVGGQPLLWHVMKGYAHHGFRDFVLCLGVKGDVVRDYFANFDRYSRDWTIDLATGSKRWHPAEEGAAQTEDWRVTLAETGLNTLKGARIKRIERYLDSDVNFLTYGDGVSDIDVRALHDFHVSHGKLLTITGVRAPSRFGEILQEDGRIERFEEKPRSGHHFINGGFMVFNRGLLEYLTTDERCDFEFDVVQDLVREGEVMMYRHEGHWACVDHERDIHELEGMLERGEAFWKVWEHQA
jgi:glucose-1-phosphate cytidylyltransferase